jgi:very-short-patch-repair endonuclease
MSDQTSKTDHIVRQLAKSNKKKFENYVVTRIWHLLNNTDIQFVTQQHVTRPSSAQGVPQRALTDMYFPQIQLHVEVDEPHHANQAQDDSTRAADIINATKHFIERVAVFDKNPNATGNPKITGIEEINKRIQEVVGIINEGLEKKFKGSIPEWDIDAEFRPKTHIDEGIISVSRNVAFRTIADACNCFGHKYSRCQRGFVKNKSDSGKTMLWFPYLYEHGEWENSITADEETIYEQKKKAHAAYSERAIANEVNGLPRITFARGKNNLGQLMYRFKDIYKLDVDKSRLSEHMVYCRTSMEVATCKPQPPSA